MSENKIDLENVFEGQIITVAEVEAHTGTVEGTKEYNFAAMNLAGEIEHRTGIVVASRDGALYLLRQGQERSDYAMGQFYQAARRVIKNARRLNTTDVSSMDNGAAQVHESRARLAAALAASAKKTNSQIRREKLLFGKSDV